MTLGLQYENRDFIGGCHVYMVRLLAVGLLYLVPCAYENELCSTLYFAFFFGTFCCWGALKFLLSKCLK